MDEIAKIEIKCRNCGKLSRSMIHSDSLASLRGMSITGNTSTCSNCGRPTPADKQDMVITMKDGRTLLGGML